MVQEQEKLLLAEYKKLQMAKGWWSGSKVRGKRRIPFKEGIREPKRDQNNNYSKVYESKQFYIIVFPFTLYLNTLIYI